VNDYLRAYPTPVQRTPTVTMTPAHAHWLPTPRRGSHGSRGATLPSAVALGCGIGLARAGSSAPCWWHPGRDSCC